VSAIMSRHISLRPASLEDVRRLYEWRNEAETCAASFNTAPIVYEDHLRWFENKVVDPKTRFLIATLADGRAVGYARFDLKGDEAEIHLSIDKTQRGKGIGTVLIRTAAEFAVTELHVRRVAARIKANNEVSLAAFSRAGFTFMWREEAGGDNIVCLCYEFLD